METVTIETRCGRITGEVQNGIRMFRGIPYATAERFEKPVQITSWDGVYDATGMAVEAIQLGTYLDQNDNFYYKEFRDGDEFKYGENPITLTVIAPESAENLPVLIYIHGGGFFTGWQSSVPGGVTHEYAERGIVFVSISYRVNVFALYDQRNLHLHDQLTAIKWVRDNIGDYGGDGGNITLIGQSAGAMSVFELLYTDCLKGIVKGAVMMSGAGFFPSFGNGYTREEARPFWDSVMKEAGASDEQELKKIPAEQLWKAWWKLKQQQKGFHLDQPGPDGEMIPCHGSEIRKSGRLLDIPLMVGVTGQDMILPLIMFTMTRDFLMWSARRDRKSVYAYYFDRIPPGNNGRSFHACDLWYVFGCMDKSHRPFTEEDYALSREMIEAVTQFTKTGEATWEPFTLRHRKFRVFNTGKRKYGGLLYALPELLHNTLFERGPF